MKKILEKLKIIKPFLVYIFEIEAKIARYWAFQAHKRLYYAEWGIKPTPEFFDHQIDLYYSWQKNRSSFWVERGVFGSLALKKGGNVLELACGDGFNARNFYSDLVDSIIACDFDLTAIKTAKNKNSASNINFVLADIRTDMPNGNFDNIVWDAAIEHFTPVEIKAIMENIKCRLKPDGVLSGYTIVENQNKKQLEQHEYEFKGMEDLYSFLKPHFKHVTVFETVHPKRHNLYFWASDAIIPFSKDWKHCIKHENYDL